jgi:hypothetical protein
VHRTPAPPAPPQPPVADTPPPSAARIANDSIEDPADIVGSLIARVLSIRIK